LVLLAFAATFGSDKRFVARLASQKKKKAEEGFRSGWVVWYYCYHLGSKKQNLNGLIFGLPEICLKGNDYF